MSQIGSNLQTNYIMMRFLILFISLSFLTNFSQAQLKKNVLFIGNSYTGVNNLPELIKQVSISAGDTVVYDANTPGGQTFQNHSTNSTTISKIQAGNWDYVVLQEQSQLPSFPDGQVASDMYPFAKYLDSMINASNSCVETIFYQTWGRKNGDAANCGFFPPLCTYEGMDSLIALRYRYMAEQNNAIISPAGAVWKYLRQNHPTIELYSGDESHPLLAGSYAAACAFYTTIFKKDPTLITFNSSLSNADAAIIRNAAKTIVYNDQANWLFDRYNPVSNFTYVMNMGEVNFTNTSTNSSSYSWNFGDGNTSTAVNPTHTFSANGTYQVKLLSTRCSGEMDSIMQSIVINTLSTKNLISESKLTLYPNPTHDFIVISSEKSIEGGYRIFNSMGKLMGEKKAISSDNTLDIRSFPSGVYFLQTGLNNEIFIQFIKE